MVTSIRYWQTNDDILSHQISRKSSDSSSLNQHLQKNSNDFQKIMLSILTDSKADNALFGDDDWFGGLSDNGFDGVFDEINSLSALPSSAALSDSGNNLGISELTDFQSGSFSVFSDKDRLKVLGARLGTTLPVFNQQSGNDQYRNSGGFSGGVNSMIELTMRAQMLKAKSFFQ